MTGWQAGFVETNGIRLHYTRTGGGGPAIVLSHGFSDDGLCWTPAAQALEADYDVIMVDARFHGLSDAPEQAFDAAVMAEDLAGVVAGLGLSAPILWGHSMGAVSTLVVAGRHPQLPRAIVLEDPPARWAPAEVRDNGDWLAKNRAWIAGLQRQAPPDIIAAQELAEPRWAAAELTPWAASKLRFRAAYFDYNRQPGLDWQELLKHITCPVLLVTGDPGRGSIVTKQQATALQALVPQARVAHIDGAGHNIRRDQFEAYMAAVRPELAAWSSR